MNISIRQYTEDDKEQILNLLNYTFSKQEYFANSRTLEWWNWKYEQNVFGKSIIVVAEHDNRIVGTRIMWAWEFVLADTTLKAYMPVDTVVHPEYQGKGLFLSMAREAMQISKEFGADLLCNFPNDQSLPGNIKLGAKFIGKLPWLIKIMKPLHLLSTLRTKEKATPFELPEKHELTESKCCEIIHDSFSTDLIHTKKSSEYIKWRYLNHPYFKYGILATRDNSEEISIIYMINKKGDRRELTVVDVIGSPKLIGKAFKHLIEVSKELDVDMILVINTNGYEMKSNTTKMGFVGKKKKNFVVLPINAALKEKALSIENWSLIGGMHDSL